MARYLIFILVLLLVFGCTSTNSQKPLTNSSADAGVIQNFSNTELVNMDTILVKINNETYTLKNAKFHFITTGQYRINLVVQPGKYDSDKTIFLIEIRSANPHKIAAVYETPQVSKVVFQTKDFDYEFTTGDSFTFEVEEFSEIGNPVKGSFKGSISVLSSNLPNMKKGEKVEISGEFNVKRYEDSQILPG
ncbi:hypothetical protein HYT84_04665 [Candidatus Micrarchaeota archaeon]|nr:hypothetical protein [Candidatus Micrarchaeota archaeon]